MTMREIQDLTLQRASEHSRLDATLRTLRNRYSETVARQSATGKYVGLHIVAAPVGGPLSLNHVFRQPDLFRRGKSPKVAFSTGGGFRLNEFGAELESVADPVRPVVRGGRQDWSYFWPRQQGAARIEDLRSVEILDSGAINTVLKISSSAVNGLCVDWILTQAAEALRIIRAVRRLGAAGEIEYAVEIDLRYDTQLGARLIPLDEQYTFGLLGEERFSKIWAGPSTTLPRYAVGSDDDLTQILGLLLRDLHNLHRTEAPALSFESID